jgi:hypothetical protein
MANTAHLSPQERLAISRKAMVKHMTRDKRAAQPTYAPETDDFENDAAAAQYSTASATWHIVQHAARTWWQHHPVNLALGIARPVLSQFAQEHPVKLVGIAAGVGVATVLLRPWRLVSLGTVLATALKTPQLPDFVLAMLSPDAGRD